MLPQKPLELCQWVAQCVAVCPHARGRRRPLTSLLTLSYQKGTAAKSRALPHREWGKRATRHHQVHHVTLNERGGGGWMGRWRITRLAEQRHNKAFTVSGEVCGVPASAVADSWVHQVLQTPTKIKLTASLKATNVSEGQPSALHVCLHLCGRNTESIVTSLQSPF